MFLSNKYTKWYYQIISFRKAHPLSGYTENHHIIPDSMGGSSTQENMVELSAREHFICHRLLLKMVTSFDKRKMARALHLMVHMKSKNHKGERNWKLSSRIYSFVKEEYSKNVSGYTHSDESKIKMSIAAKASRTPEVIEKIAQAQRGRKLPDERKRKISEAAKRQWQDPEMRAKASEAALNRPTISDATKQKMKESSANRDLTSELRSKFSTAKDVWTGRNHSEESKKKISEARMGKPATPSETVVCPHCGKEGKARGISGYHFDKCKTLLNIRSGEKPF